jgi:hypothetical protein
LSATHFFFRERTHLFTKLKQLLILLLKILSNRLLLPGSSSLSADLAERILGRRISCAELEQRLGAATKVAR